GVTAAVGGGVTVTVFPDVATDILAGLARVHFFNGRFFVFFNLRGSGGWHPLPRARRQLEIVRSGDGQFNVGHLLRRLEDICPPRAVVVLDKEAVVPRLHQPGMVLRPVGLCRKHDDHKNHRHGHQHCEEYGHHAFDLTALPAVTHLMYSSIALTSVACGPSGVNSMYFSKASRVPGVT